MKSCHGYGGEYASGVSDLTRSPWLRAALLIGAVGLAVYGLVSQWAQVQAALGKLDGWDVAGAAVCAIAGLGCMMLAWRALLADLGSPLPLPAAIRVMFVGQLGKYVPGAVWAVAAQVELAQRRVHLRPLRDQPVAGQPHRTDEQRGAQPRAPGEIRHASSVLAGAAMAVSLVRWRSCHSSAARPCWSCPR